jgi:hypothetical protein
MGVELRHALGAAALALRRAQIEKTSAADGSLRGHIPDDETVSGGHGKGAIQNQLHPVFRAGPKLVAPQRHDARANLRRRMM